MAATAAANELSLFILRSQVLALYRSFIRTCRHIPGSNRDEVLSEVRREFRAQQRAPGSDPPQPYAVKYMLSDGRTKLKMLEEMIGMRM